MLYCIYKVRSDISVSSLTKIYEKILGSVYDIDVGIGIKGVNDFRLHVWTEDFEDQEVLTRTIGVMILGTDAPIGALKIEEWQHTPKRMKEIFE